VKLGTRERERKREGREKERHKQKEGRYMKLYQAKRDNTNIIA
jgi:hypothetical protein